MTQPTTPHGSRYQRLVADAKSRIREVTAAELARDALPPGTRVLDVREADELSAGRLPEAEHVSKGVIETRIEELVPVLDTPIVCYCAGGNRSALVADSLAKMGYTAVRSLAGGFKAWVAAGNPVVR